MNPESRPYTAFSCEYGLFEFNVMPMGLTNSGATFQRHMDDIFKNLTDKFLMVYIDDIIVYSVTIEEHFEHLSI